MDEKSFVRKVIERRSLPPLWMWRPAWLRRFGLILWVPLQLALFVSVVLPLYAIHTIRTEWRSFGSEWMTYIRDVWHGRRIF